MKFRSSYETEYTPETGFANGYKLVNGVFLHGKVEAHFGNHDGTVIAPEDIEPFKVLMNGGKGINGLKVEVEGYPGETLLYAWPSTMGVPLIVNPGFEMLRFCGMIVDKDDARGVKYAKKCFADKRQIF